MQLPILPLHDFELQACFLEEFFFEANRPQFVFTTSTNRFTYYNNSFITLFSDIYDIKKELDLTDFFVILHKDDITAVQTLFQITQLPIKENTAINIRTNQSVFGEAVFNLHVRYKVWQDGSIILLGTMQNITDKIKYEELQQKSDNTFRELSFITSHELRHEYAKIQSIIQMLDKDIVTNEEKKLLIEGARESIQIINSTIFKINHKLSFNQRDPFFTQDKQHILVNRVVIVDDDHLTNIINKRVIKNASPNIEIEIFLDTEEALHYLREYDKQGSFLILLDVNFPYGSGWDFLDQYQHYTTRSRVVVLSSSIDTVDRQRASNYAVVSDYLTKPLSPERIKSLLSA